jgi:hypothetical protein
LGLVTAIIKAVLKLANLRVKFGWDVPPALLRYDKDSRALLAMYQVSFDSNAYLSFAAPCAYIALGTLGILLWYNMPVLCAASYAASYGLLLFIFKFQVVMLGVSQKSTI